MSNQSAAVASDAGDPLALFQGPLYWFRDWPNETVPKISAGVYTIWQGARFIYAGMSGRGRTADYLQRRQAGSGAHGLYTRLASHASGRRSGDQFCVYVADRLVLAHLTPEEIQLVSTGEHSLDVFVRRYIHAELSYRFFPTADGANALNLEGRVRSGIFAAGAPLLNPQGRSRRDVR